MKKRQIDRVKKLDLAIFEAKLQTMAKEGAFDSAMEESLNRLVRETEPAMLSDNELQQFYQTVRKASHENAIIEARGKTPATELPFGRHLQLIRDKSGLSQADIARLLNKDISYIEKIENGQISPLKLLAGDLADIMQIFRLTLTELKTTIKAFLSLHSVKTGRIRAMARSSIRAGIKEKGDSLAHAMDATLQAIAKKKHKTVEKEDTIKIDPEYLGAIERVLKERGEEALLI